MTQFDNSRQLLVLESVRRPRSTTNPYLVQLIDSLEATREIQPVFFSFPHAIFGRYDLFHVHWPEVMFTGRRRLGRLVKRILTALVLARIALTRTPVVRTWHNTERPTGLSRMEYWLLDGFEALTTLRIRLNEVSDFDDAIEYVTIPHPSYRTWFGGFQRSQQIPGRFGFVGLIRRYKGVETLVHAFHGMHSADYSLRIAGNPSSPELSDHLVNASRADSRLSLRLEFLPDEELVKEVTSTTLIVLPYRQMHNSGMTLAALSLDRPVLVPDNEVNRRLANEVGQEWVLRYSGELTSAKLDQAMAAASQLQPGSRPDLSRRSWDEAGSAHLAAFRRALAVAQSKRRGRQ